MAAIFERIRGFREIFSGARDAALWIITEIPVNPTAAPVTMMPGIPPIFAPAADPWENSSSTDAGTVSHGIRWERIRAVLPKKVTDAMTAMQDDAAEDTAYARCPGNPPVFV